MSAVDLHIHTSASDGRFSPSEVVARAAEAGMCVIAITDHDTIDGIGPALEAARAYSCLTVVPGIELSTDIPAGEAHVLGYFIDHTEAGLRAALVEMQESRRERARKMVARLAQLGCRIEWKRVCEIASSATVGRPHIARAMVEKGCVNSFQDAFIRYIGRDGPAYVERHKTTPAQAVGLVVAAGGLPVLAHPFTVPDPEAMVAELRGVGLVGLEVYYKDYALVEVERLRRLAERHSLLMTGGTDYHGLDPATEIEIGGREVPAECAERLIALAQRLRAQSTIAR